MLEKMARRLLIAGSCLSVLVGERLALMAVVRALRQWIMQSSAVKTGRLSVQYQKMTVSDTTFALCCYVGGCSSNNGSLPGQCRSP